MQAMLAASFNLLFAVTHTRLTPHTLQIMLMGSSEGIPEKPKDIVSYASVLCMCMYV